MAYVADCLLASDNAAQANVGFDSEQRTWPERARSDAIVPMLSKKVFFSDALVRWSENDVGGHMINPISNWLPS